MAPDGKARWKASLIEQLITKNALRENASNPTRHLIGPFLVLVSLLAVLHVDLHWLAHRKLQVYDWIFLSRGYIARSFHRNFTYKNLAFKSYFHGYCCSHCCNLAEFSVFIFSTSFVYIHVCIFVCIFVCVYSRTIKLNAVGLRSLLHLRRPFLAFVLWFWVFCAAFCHMAFPTVFLCTAVNPSNRGQLWVA